MACKRKKNTLSTLSNKMLNIVQMLYVQWTIVFIGNNFGNVQL